MTKWVGAAVLAMSLLLATGAAAQAPARKPASPEEAAALKSLSALFKDSTTPPARFNSAIADFRLQFPASAYMLPVLVLGERYSRAHSDYPAMLDYGLAALGLEPHDLYSLSTLGAAIPDNVKDSDLDREQRLQQAAGFDQQVITVVEGWMITPSGLQYGGIHYTESQAKTLRDNLGGPAYLALGRIRALQQQYPDAVTAYQQALKFQTAPLQQAQTYYDMAVAEGDGGQAPAAQAALAKAKTLGAGSPFLQRMIEIEEAKLAAPGPG
ncbi:MAG: hypothetical protein ACRD1L_02360 [Terriglobales bacterium]